MDKSFSFALDVVALCRYLSETKREYVLSRQMLKAGTSIGANVRESHHAESTADFIHKLSISLKEAHESEYWIELLHQSNLIETSDYNSLTSILNEIISMLTASIKTSKKKLNH